jgi:hypothetical protein
VQPDIQEEVIPSPRSNSSRNHPHIPLIHNIPTIPVHIPESSANSAHQNTQSNFKSTIIAGSSREPIWSTVPAPIAQKNIPGSQEIQYMDRFILRSQSESFLSEEQAIDSNVNPPMTINNSEITSIENHESYDTEIENIFLDNVIQISEEVVDRRSARSLSSRSSEFKSKTAREKPQPSPTPSVVPSPNLLGFIQNLKFVHLPEENTELKRARTQTTSEIPNPFIATPRETSSRGMRPKLTPVTPFRFNRKKPTSAHNLETQDQSPQIEDPVLYKFQEEIQEELGGSDQWLQDSNSGLPKFVYEEDSPPPYSYAKSNEASENFFNFSAYNL